MEVDRIVAASEQVEQVAASSPLEGREAQMTWLLLGRAAARAGGESQGASNSLEITVFVSGAPESESSTLHEARQRPKPAIASRLCSWGGLLREAYCFALEVSSLPRCPWLPKKPGGGGGTIAGKVAASLLSGLPAKNPGGGGGTTAGNVAALVDLDNGLALHPNTSFAPGSAPGMSSDSKTFTLWGSEMGWENVSSTSWSMVGRWLDLSSASFPPMA